MLAPYTEAHESGPLLDLLIRSLDLYDGWIEDVRVRVRGSASSTAGAAASKWHSTGNLPRTCAALAQQSARNDARGSIQRARDSWNQHLPRPSLEPCRFPDHGYVAAPDLTAALARVVAAGGGRVQTASRAVARRCSTRVR